MAELGETADLATLVPGNPAVLHETALSMTTYADVLEEAGRGLDRVATPAGWSGVAAEQYRATFAVQPRRWLDAGGAHREAARAVEAHAATMEWAQRQAGDAVRLWDEGRSASLLALHDPGATVDPATADPGLEPRERAERLLGDARAQLAVAGDRAAAVVGAARDRAPVGPDMGERIAEGVQEGATAVGNAAASLGNAALHHPLDVAGVLGGAGLVAASAAGVVGSVALDATGVGALGGVPLGAASIAGVATGAGLIGAGAIDLALHAAGPDRVAPFQVNTDADPPASPPSPEPPNEITGQTKHGEERAAGRDGGRGVSDEAMADAVEHPTEPPTYGSNGTFKYVGKDAVVVLTPEGQTVTTWARSAAGWRNR